MTFEIKTVDPAEFTSWNDVLGTVFFLTSDAEAVAGWRRGHTDFDRTWAAYDDDRIVATFRSFGTEITVPGGLVVTADAVTNVSTLATHRRRGALTAMMVTSLRAAVDRGDPLSILIAARWPIYGRYGYGPAVDSAAYTIDTNTADFGATSRDGVVDYLDTATGRAVAPRVFEQFRRSQPGAISRDHVDFDRQFGLVTVPGKPAWAGRVVAHRSTAGSDVDGYLRYHVEDNWTDLRPNSAVVVDDLIATTPAAYAALWRFCCELDNVAAVKAADRSVDEPLVWLLADARAMVQTSRTDFLWARVLDVPAALSARRYLAEGAVVLEVRDALNHAAGRYLVDGGPDGATCVRTTESADIELNVATLSSAYLGGVSLRSLARAGLVSEHRAGALGTADAMFRSESTPWCNTWF